LRAVNTLDRDWF